MIYILHNQQDRVRALELITHLEESGFPAFVSPTESLHQLPDTINTVDAVMIIVSPSLLQGGGSVLENIQHIKELGKPILPLLDGITRNAIQTEYKEWYRELGNIATAQITSEGIGGLMPKLIQALRVLGVARQGSIETGTAQSSKSRKNFRIGRWAIIAIAVLVLGAAGYLYLTFHTGPTVVTLRIHGSNTIGKSLMPKLVTAYVQKKQGAVVSVDTVKGNEEKEFLFTLPDSKKRYSIEVFAHGSGTGFTDIISGDCDIAMSSRPAKNTEAQTFKEKGLGLLTTAACEHIIGLDGIAVIVNSANVVRNLNIKQLADIFAGKMTRWSEVGGRDMEIHIYARDEKSGTFEMMQGLVLKRYGYSNVAATAKRFEDSDLLSDAVSKDLDGIGFIGLPYINNAKAVSVADGGASPIFPNVLTVSREDYPLARRLFLYTSENPQNSETREFIQFVFSEEGQKIVRADKFIDLMPTVENNPFCDPNASKEYLEATQSAKRLSVTFRFMSSGNSLDNKAVSDLERIVNFVRQNGDPQLLLLGFSDNEGTAVSNQALSLSRSQAVAAELHTYGVNVAPAHVYGFGSELPVSTNDTPEGKQKNRRVEVWLK
jgi:phosphate transport system substrate-binding protein